MSDVHLWAAGPFVHQWNKYTDGAALRLAGFTRPDFQFPPNVEFVSLGDFRDYPANRWSNALWLAVRDMPKLFIFTLEDFWLTRPVDVAAVNVLHKYFPGDVLRIDLTSDRLNAKTIDDRPAAIDVGSLGRLDVIECLRPSPYFSSTMPAIWDRDKMMEMIIPGETPWDFEISGSRRAEALPYRVLGTRQWPMRNTIAIQRGQLDLKAAWMVPPSPMRSEDIAELKWLGFLEGRE